LKILRVVGPLSL